MPRIIETTVYEIHELEEAAKARARNWYVTQVLNNDPQWHDAVLNDFETICGILGITIRTLEPRRSGAGGTGASRRCIWFSGFCQQGDGASFEGTWEHAAGASRRIREHAPLDERLHAIADALTAAQRPNFYQLAARITHRGRYSHEYCMQFEIERDDDQGREPTEGSERAVSEAMRDLARWLYRTLEAEYESESSDSVVDDAIHANEWPFRADGTFFVA